MKEKELRIRKSKGITLVALVVTIIVLIILATISINVIFGEQGILEKLTSAKKQQKIAEYIEEFNLIEADVAASNKGIVTLDSFADKVKENQLIEEGNIIKNESSYTLISKEGYIFEAKLKAENDVEVIYNGSTTSSTEIELNATMSSSGKVITAKVTLGKDANITESKWIYTKTSEKLGTNAETYTNSFTTNPETIDLVEYSAGTYYLHVLTVYNLGNKTETISQPIELVADELKIKDISAGGNHSLALDTAGRLWTWGYNYQGQLRR